MLPINRRAYPEFMHSEKKLGGKDFSISHRTTAGFPNLSQAIGL